MKIEILKETQINGVTYKAGETPSVSQSLFFSLTQGDSPSAKVFKVRTKAKKKLFSKSED